MIYSGQLNVVYIYEDTVVGVFALTSPQTFQWLSEILFYYHARYHDQ